MFDANVGRLIAEVRRRPELWDRQHSQHHNRSVLDQQWNVVADTLAVTSKAARGRWKNLKDHFRKEYKRCMSAENDQEISRWPYFHSMMFIREQISYTATNSLFLSDLQNQNIYPEVKIQEDSDESNNPLNCLNIEYDNENSVEVKSNYIIQNENISEDQHFLFSLLPMFSVLPPDKKLKARIAIETSLLNIAYPELSTTDNPQVGQKNASQKSPVTKAEKRKRTMTEDKRPTKKRNMNSTKIC